MLVVTMVQCLVFLAVLVLSIPIDLALSYERGEGSRSQMRIGWLFGLIGKRGAEELKRASGPERGQRLRRKGLTPRPVLG